MAHFDPKVSRSTVVPYHLYPFNIPQDYAHDLI